jgi:hypothetical protein
MQIQVLRIDVRLDVQFIVYLGITHNALDNLNESHNRTPFDNLADKSVHSVGQNIGFISSL